MEATKRGRAVPCRLRFDESDGGVWRVEIELSLGHFAFISVRDRLDSIDGSRVVCHVSGTDEIATLRATFWDGRGRLLFERKIYDPDGSLPAAGLNRLVRFNPNVV